MEIKKRGGDVTIIGDKSQNNKFGIAKESQAAIMNALIDLYSDPIGSVVREITSNCIDAHRERDMKIAGKRKLDKGDDVKYYSDRLTVEIDYVERNAIMDIDSAFIFRDFGVGLSDERVSKIYTQFGESTKRVGNDEIGGFGIGCKSPFAYNDTFYIRTRYNGVESMYMMNRGTKEPSMDLVDRKETKDLNGTEVIIPMKSSTDSYSFITAINSQLVFFENVVFKNIDSVGTIEKPNILESTDDYILVEKQGGVVQALIGNVIYNIDSSIISVDADFLWAHCPMFIRFNIGELDLVPSREGIRYTEHTIKVIKDKFKLIQNKFVNDINHEFSNSTDLIEWMRVVYSHTKKSHNYRGKNFNNPIVHKLEFSMYETSDAKFGKSEFNPFELTPAQFFTGMSVRKVYKDDDKKYSMGYTPSTHFITNNWSMFLNDSHDVFHFDDKYSRKKDYAIIETHSENFFKFKTEGINDNAEEAEIALFTNRYGNIAKGARDLEEIKSDYDFISKAFMNSKHTFLASDIDDNFLDKKNLISNTGESDEEDGNVFTRIGINDDEDMSAYWRGSNTSSEYLSTTNDLIVYGFSEHSEMLKDAMRVFGKKSKFHQGQYKVFKISKDRERHFVKHVFIEDFFSMNHEEIAKYYTAYMISERISSFTYLKKFDVLDKNIFDKYSQLNKIVSQDYSHFMNGHLRRTIEKHCDESKLIDQNLIAMADEVVEYCEGLEILKYISEMHEYYNTSQEVINTVKDLLVLKGKIKETEEAQQEEPIII